ncbi:MAG: hypothetical protein EOP62_01095 [Sphingomonadales bacterium]|nr:MAG: hypothetical protein EOP62_01095 [Sphingomonadales bacterium]
MSEVYLGRGESRRMLRLGKLLGEGASGKVHGVEGGFAAKLYHGPEEARRYEAKIEAMLARPPELPATMHRGASYPQIAWPTAKLHDRAGSFIGFLMPEVRFAHSTSLVNLLQKNSRKLEGISDYYGYRVLVARNLASVFTELHRAGHHMIDMKPANLRFYPAMSWMAVVDADGFSIAGTNGRIGALQLSDEYIAPESWKRKPAELGLEQDLFALAAIIFQLLNNGVHPFAGTVTGSDATDLQTRIVEGLYPYAIAPRPSLTPSTASVHRMFRRQTREMFDTAFLTARRPSAAEWRDHLDELVAQLVPCSARPNEHVHFGAGCGFCGHEARIEAVRAVPRRVVQPRSPVSAVQPRGALFAAQAPRVARPVRAGMPRQPGILHPLPRKRRSRMRFVVGSSLVVALLAGFVVGSDRLLQEITARQAFAATAPSPEPSFGGQITPLPEPIEYRILPPSGGEAVEMREGPGAEYPALGVAKIEEALLGSGSAPATDGSLWILVTRTGGISGLVPASALIARTDIVAPLDCPAGKVCDDGTLVSREHMIGIRYLELLGRSNAAGRAKLEAEQRDWEVARIACNTLARPAECRSDISARRSGVLDDFAIGNLR